MLEKNSNGTLTILAFPCNQFHLQEPGENHELLNGLKYVRPGHNWEPHQNMHIFGKLEVNGDNNHPLYEFLKVLFFSFKKIKNLAISSSPQHFIEVRRNECLER